MIFSIFPKMTLVAETDALPSYETARKLISSHAERNGLPIEFLNERACSLDGHDYDIVLRKKKERFLINLRRR